MIFVPSHLILTECTGSQCGATKAVNNRAFSVTVILSGDTVITVQAMKERSPSFVLPLVLGSGQGKIDKTIPTTKHHQKLQAELIEVME